MIIVCDQLNWIIIVKSVTTNNNVGYDDLQMFCPHGQHFLVDIGILLKPT